jgi:putative spermidine/putrescine transport system permease protein
MGDYVTVQLVGGTGQMLGNLVYSNFSTDLPFGRPPLRRGRRAAAAAVMTVYLLTIRRTGVLARL